MVSVIFITKVTTTTPGTTTTGATTTVETTTTGATTTEHICDEDMDEYGPVDVTRSTDPETDLEDDGFWSPSSLSNTSNPYEGSPLTIATSSPVQLTSLQVDKQDGDDTPVVVTIRVKPVGSDEFVPVINPETGTPFFEVIPGEKFPLPDDMPPGDAIEVYVVEPGSDSPLDVTPFGCEHPGKCEQNISFGPH